MVVSVPAHAENWVEVYSPRSGHEYTGYIDRDSIKIVGSIKRVSIKITYINDKDGADYTLAEYDINCESSTYAKRAFRTYYKDGSAQSRGPFNSWTQRPPRDISLNGRIIAGVCG